MRKGFPETIEAALAEAQYYGRNFAPKANLEVDDCEQEARTSAWIWWERGRRNSDLWRCVSRDLWDYARRINGRQRTGAVPR